MSTFMLKAHIIRYTVTTSHFECLVEALLKIQDYGELCLCVCLGLAVLVVNGKGKSKK